MTDLREAEERKAFEAEISGPPYERDPDRWPDDQQRYAWPGSYCDLAVNLAWHMWTTRAALSVPAGWKPIKTVPRTGEMVLMWSRNAGFFSGNWPQGCAAGEWLQIDGDWRGSSNGCAQEATHWMPLPAALSPQEPTP